LHLFLKKQNSGSIVSIASTLGFIAIPNASPYSASKAAVIQLTQNLALALGSFNIRVNSPSIHKQIGTMGLTEEQLKNICISTFCIKRLVQAQEIANLVVFLASDLCQFMTGANLVIDGGSSII
jgi:NAD(P)-dependent dehydrogenase (short-subunit alcohol dehydrogenase family)